MSDEQDALAWARYAEEDFQTAKILPRRKKPMLAGVCFHTQQSAEKYLKALLVAKQKEFPKIHDLDTLNELCNQAGVFTGFDKDSLDRLTDYAVFTRYPGNQPILDEAREALEIAKSIRKFVRGWFGLR